MNNISETIFYNKRIIISAPIENPITWRCTKVEQISPQGISHLTFAQTEFNPHVDYIEHKNDSEINRLQAIYDKSENKTEKNKILYQINMLKEDNDEVIGMWASYWENSTEPESPPEDEPTWLRSSITCSGIRPFLKVGGGYKTLTVNFTKDDEAVKPLLGNWHYFIADDDVSTLIVEKSTDQDNQIKIKFAGDESYIGQLLTVTHVTDKTKSSIEIPIEAI